MIVRPPIPPFPETIDRRHFASWLSGFTDGEGCFVISRKNHDRPQPTFSISLRKDDLPALQLIQSFWQTGVIYGKVRHKLTYHNQNAKPSMQLHVTRLADMAHVLVPHFDAFPLLAKKRRDYAVWKVAVLFCDSLPRFGRKQSRRYSPASVEYLINLAATLRNGRKYEAEPADTPVRLKPKIRSLFELE